jgi:hypothetical protein
MRRVQDRYRSTCTQHTKDHRRGAASGDVILGVKIRFTRTRVGELQDFERGDSIRIGEQLIGAETKNVEGERIEYLTVARRVSDGERTVRTLRRQAERVASEVDEDGEVSSHSGWRR